MTRLLGNIPDMDDQSDHSQLQDLEDQLITDQPVNIPDMDDQSDHRK